MVKQNKTGDELNETSGQSYAADKLHKYESNTVGV